MDKLKQLKNEYYLNANPLFFQNAIIFRFTMVNEFWLGVSFIFSVIF